MYVKIARGAMNCCDQAVSAGITYIVIDNISLLLVYKCSSYSHV